MRFLLSCILALVGFAHAEERLDERSFLLEGDYYGHEAPTKPGEGWFALIVANDQWHLVPTDVYATRVHDVCMDAEDGETGTSISSKHPSLALLRIPSLRPGKIDTPNMRFTNNARSILWTRSLDITFNSQSYQILVDQSKIYLKKGKQRTELPELTVSKDQDTDLAQSAALLWAGDLDRDGALDIIVSYSGYSSSGACLFLSSMGSSRELIGHVACHGRVGC